MTAAVIRSLAPLVVQVRQNWSDPWVADGDLEPITGNINAGAPQ